MNKAVRNLIGIIVIVVVVVAGVWYVVAKTDLVGGDNVVLKDSGSNISDFTAVFLTNGQVYFGKMYQDNSETIDLRDIFYLQVNSDSSTLQNGSSSNSSNNQVSLVKLGNELHGPNDRMLINKQQVLFTESLKDDSKVVTAINNYQG